MSNFQGILSYETTENHTLINSNKFGGVEKEEYVEQLVESVSIEQVYDPHLFTMDNKTKENFTLLDSMLEEVIFFI